MKKIRDKNKRTKDIKLTKRRKKELERAVKKVIREYGECLRKLGNS